MDAPRFETPVVPEKHDNGIVRHPLFPQRLENPSHPHVHSRNRVEIPGPFLAHDRMIRVIRGRIDVLGGGNLRMPVFSDPRHTFLLPGFAVVDVVLRLRRVDHGEERLVRFQFRPVGGVVQGAFVHEIQVELAGADLAISDMRNVGRVIPHVRKAMGKRADPVRQTIVVVPVRPHMVHVGRRLVHARHKRGAARRTHRRGRVYVREAQPFTRQTVQIGRGHILHPVDAQIERHILAHNPEDVRAIRLQRDAFGAGGVMISRRCSGSKGAPGAKNGRKHCYASGFGD